MSARAERVCSPEELRALGMVFNFIATSAAAMADLSGLSCESSPDVRDSLAQALEAMARHIGAAADAAGDWCGEGRCIGDATTWLHEYGREGPLSVFLMTAESQQRLSQTQGAAHD